MNGGGYKKFGYVMIQAGHSYSVVDKIGLKVWSVMTNEYDYVMRDARR